MAFNKEDLRNVFWRGINSTYVILRLKTEQGTSFHYIPNKDKERDAFKEYYEQHFWVTPESNGKLIDIREGEQTEITGGTWGGSSAIVNIW